MSNEFYPTRYEDRGDALYFANDAGEGRVVSKGDDYCAELKALVDGVPQTSTEEVPSDTQIPQDSAPVTEETPAPAPTEETGDNTQPAPVLDESAGPEVTPEQTDSVVEESAPTEVTEESAQVQG